MTTTDNLAVQAARLADQVGALERQLQQECHGRLEAERNVCYLLATQHVEDVLADELFARRLQTMLDDEVMANDLQQEELNASAPVRVYDDDEMFARSLEYDDLQQAAAPGLA
jgi:hypothetical protein